MQYRLFLLVIMGLCALAVWRCRPADEPRLAPAPGRAVPPAAAWNAPAQLVFDRFTTEDNLCGNTITALFQDRQGFLWIGSEDGLNRYDGYRFEAFRYKAGNPRTLAANEVLAIGEDSRGHLWVLHPEGLSEIAPDKTVVRHPDTLPARGLGGAWRVMTIDAKDRIWFQRGGSVCCFDIARRRYTRVLDATGVPLLHPDSSLYLFAGFCPTGADTCRHEVLRWNETESRFVRLSDTLINLAGDQKGLGYNDGAFDAGGRLWFSRQDGWLLRYDFERRRFDFFPPRPGVPARYNLGGTLRDICYSRSNNALWLAGFGGVIRYDLTPGARRPIVRYEQQDQFPQGLPVRVASTVLEDRSANLWVGTFGGGLCRYAPGKNKFRVYRKDRCDTAGPAGNKVETLCFDGEGRLWAGFDKGLSLLEDPWDGRFRNFYHPPVPGVLANPNWITDLAADTAGEHLYPAYWGNVPDVFDTRTLQFRPLPSANLPPAAADRWLRSIAIPYTSSVARDGQGALYYGAYGEFLQKFDPASGVFTFYGWANWEEAVGAGLPNGLTTVAYPTADGTLWLGTAEDKGLVRVDFSKARPRVHGEPIYNPLFPHVSPDSALRVFHPRPGDSTALQGGVIHDLLEDRRGRLWIATNRGLHWLKDRERGIFHHFGLQQGLPDEQIHALINDARGQLWLGTNRGLCCFDPETGRATAVYRAEDGLPDNAFLARSCARGPRGELAFGTANGFCLFHPDSLFANPTAPVPALCNVEINGVPRAWTPGGLTLGHTEKNIAFDFTVLDFGNPRENRYQYFLEGYDAGWGLPTADHRAVYTNLPPGRYTFRARGCHHDGIWSWTEIAFPMHIRAPWWGSWWFRVVAALAVLGAAGWWIRRREQHLRQKQEDAEKLIKYLQVQTLQAQINPHFIFNVLGAMQNQILNSDAGEANRHLVSLAKLIRRFLDSSVGSAPPGRGVSGNTIPLEQEIELLRLYIDFEQLQRPGKFEYTLDVDPAVNVHNTMIPPMIIQPYVENAVKHGLLYKDGPGRLDIRFSQTRDTLLCTISDDGVGREAAAEIQERSHKLYKSHGTRLVRERVDILNDMGHHIDIQTEDRPGGGTTVLIQFTD